MAGEQAAMELLFYRYQRPVYNAAYRLLGNGEDAKDVTQVVFMKVFEHLADYDDRYRFFSWIYRIAVNESLNRLRGSGREVQDENRMDSAPASETTDPEYQLAQSERDGQVQRAIMELNADDRLVIILKHFQEFSYHDIGEILEIPEKTVKSRLYSARQRLMSVMKDQDPA